jgi:hypothetical protein
LLTPEHQMKASVHYLPSPRRVLFGQGRFLKAGGARLRRGPLVL